MKKVFLSRIKKIIIPWYIAFICIYFVNIITSLIFKQELARFTINKNPILIILNLLLLHGFIPEANNTVMPGGWYIGATIILYLLSPIIIRFFKEKKYRVKFYIITSLISVLLLVLIKIFLPDIFGYKEFGYFLFLTHYSEYCLGMMLYFESREKLLNKKEQKNFMCLGVVFVCFAIFLFVKNFANIGLFLSSWISALATYLFIYTGISFENSSNYKTCLLKKISIIGKNSYCIYLFHTIFAWTFIEVLILPGIDINSYMWYIALLPIILIASCAFGIKMNRVIRNCNKALFLTKF